MSDGSHFHAYTPVEHLNGASFCSDTPKMVSNGASFCSDAPSVHFFDGFGDVVAADGSHSEGTD